MKTRQDEENQLPRWEIPDVAHDTGSNIPMPSKNTLDQIREQAKNEGYDAGYQQGYQQGQAEVIKLQQRLTVLAQSLAKPLSIIDDDVHESLIKLVQMICSRILRKELSLDPNILSELLQEVKELLMDASGVTVYANPQEVVLLKERVPVADQNIFEFIEDNAVPIGGCRIKTKNTNINAEIEKRIDRLLFEK